MRVIAGTARSLPLKSVPGDTTRPTTDRIKETLFNMITPYIGDGIFVDLFAGSGGIGIEAISRGASFAYFADNAAKAVSCIEENLKFTRFTDNAKVIKTDAVSAVHMIETMTSSPAAVIFMDPPYGNELENDVLRALSNSSLVDEDTLIVIEEEIHVDLSFAEELGFEIYKEKKYKSNKHVWLVKSETK